MSILITVGLPARGKSYISQKLKRSLKWIGYNVKVFNAGEWRRENYVNDKGLNDTFFNEDSVDLELLPENEFMKPDISTIQTLVETNKQAEDEQENVQVTIVSDSEEDELDTTGYEHIEHEEYCKFDIDQTVCKNVLSNYLQSDASEYVTFIRKKTCKELRILLKQCQISTVGKKQELINKLIVIRQKIN